MQFGLILLLASLHISAQTHIIIMLTMVHTQCGEHMRTILYILIHLWHIITSLVEIYFSETVKVSNGKGIMIKS